jgi:hypothetical protein
VMELAQVLGVEKVMELAQVLGVELE